MTKVITVLRNIKTDDDFWIINSAVVFFNSKKYDDQHISPKMCKKCDRKMCKKWAETPKIKIGTQCGIGIYQFKNIGYRNGELILEFLLVMDKKHTDCENISYNLGNRCVLTASQYLYAYEYNAFAWWRCMEDINCLASRKWWEETRWYWRPLNLRGLCIYRILLI